MNTYPLTHTNREHELTLINEILKNNGCQQQSTTKSPKKHPQTHKTRKQNGLHSHTSAQRLEQSPTYFGTLTSELQKRQPTELDTS
jgi:hypothetical protein